MEYLTRVLNFTTEVLDFKYHSLCGRLILHHLKFTDDLLLFFRGDKQSVILLLRSFATFSTAFGLEINKQKSNIYFNGVHRTIKDQILASSGCVKGHIPFKYLGVPIAAGKLGKKECQILVEKIIERIRMFGTRKISYAGRDGTSAYMRVPLVGWEQVCTQKVEGGLGIRYSLHWNIATMGKLVWWIYSMSDNLCVKWVHQIYLRGSS
ncbi:uncharacterized protein LOC141620188 [Silene latifolia]|uniref:uncharacterized protein LOC141620188 n=1 Tax=Silene latifolia TaxID=37657 RepID=UPI003D77126F